MKIELSAIVENQLPQYVREEFPLAVEFLKQYYISDNGSKIVQNLEDYLDLDVFFDTPETTTLTNSITTESDVIPVESTQGFPDSFGLLKIDDEIITYTSKTATQFEGCVRGFSGIDSINYTVLNFTETNASAHVDNSTVENLSAIFLKTFFFKTKQKIAPGFENRDFYSNINQSNLLKNIKNFFQSKGTQESFNILFRALYGKKVEVVLPRDQLFSASNADYRVTKNLVVEALQGDPFGLVNGTLYQDKSSLIPEARGTVNKVERFYRNNKNYYVLKLDFAYDKDIDVSGTIKSNFVIHPQTIATSDVIENSTYLDVDSTVGFPEAGELVLTNESGLSLVISYTSKTFNQFLGCNGIEYSLPGKVFARYNTFAYGYDKDGLEVRVRTTGVLSSPEFLDKTYSFVPGDPLEIETLGYPSLDYKANNWMFNIPLEYVVDNINYVGEFNYDVTTIDPNIFTIGDDFILSSGSQTYNGSVVSVLNPNRVRISLGELITLNDNLTYTIKKLVSKVNFDGKPGLSIYSSNIQNTFVDNNDSVIVLSPSLPTYAGNALPFNILKVNFPSTVDGTEITIAGHSFFTGDSVVYTPSNASLSSLKAGVYFVKKINIDTIKLATSRDNVYINGTTSFVTLTGTSNGGTLELLDLVDETLQTKPLLPQNVIRKLAAATVSKDKIDTPISAIGMFNNGVELLNYKSPQQLFYGPLLEVFPTSSGSGYDVINPPTLTVTDLSGSLASVFPVVRGALQRIDVLDGGFDYLDDPYIEIRGGNGQNAKAVPNLIEFTHIEFFNSAIDVDIVSDVVGFTTYHKFRIADEVVYKTNSQTSIGGLVADQKYFVSPKSGTTLSLHKTQQDANLGINSINLSSYGSGVHSFESTIKKKKVSSVSILDSGENYEYRYNRVKSSDINSNSIEVPNHGFKSGEIVYYTVINTGFPSVNLTNNTQYYVTVVDKDHVKLSIINTLGEKDFYYKTKQYVNITYNSPSRQWLSYPSISVEIKGKTGVYKFGSESFNANVVPVFRGEIIAVSIHINGRNYGTPEVLDLDRQPTFTLSKGSGAQLKPVIVDGRIKSVIVLSRGANYKAQPDIIISGDGNNAILTPIIENESIIEVKIISEGFGYTQDKTTISVVASGVGAKFKAQIKSWRVNLFERLNNFDQSQFFQHDGGVIVSTATEGLQYCNLFAPISLRKTLFSTQTVNGEKIYTPDLVTDESGTEINSTNHSPIIGWAYDGNPIYGPYGYATKFNATSIKQLQSGYALKTNSQLSLENRPSTLIYTPGFFVEDFEFVDSGDLDEHNGRYCVTPEFPNGTYAYFASFDINNAVSGSFIRYKKPKFPYVIGNTYYSTPIDFNFDINSNQEQISLNDLSVLRNTTPYNLLSKNTTYDGMFIPFEGMNQAITVKSVHSGKIDAIVPLSSGIDYKINDKITIENDNSAVVSSILGKTITNIESNVSNIENVELFVKNNQIIGYSTVPHGIENLEYADISAYNGNNFLETLKVQTNELLLLSGIGTNGITGITTHLNVNGNISNDAIRENDLYQLDSEIVKILSVDEKNSRIWVLRDYSGSVGINTHVVGAALTELPRKFAVNNTNITTSTVYNQEYYFNPQNSVAIGTQGITTVVYTPSSNTGINSVIVPIRTIYLPNHKIETNDRLFYSSNGGNPLSVSTNGITTVSLGIGTTVYAAKFNENLIGLSFNPVAIGTTSGFVGINTTTGLLYFTGIGTGQYHSLKTTQSPLLADVLTQSLVVSTDAAHNLSLKDKVKLHLTTGITTTVKFKYSDANGVILAKEKTILSVDITNNIITFDSHNFITGEKVVYVAGNQPISGLQTNNIYYVIAISKFKIKLASSYYNATTISPVEVDITGFGNGTISSVNPLINIDRNSTVLFDLSDPSFGYTINGFNYPAFGFKLFKDEYFSEEYFTNEKTPNPNVTSSGIIGSDGVITLTTTNDSPSVLYYNIIPLQNESIPDVKNNKFVDTDQRNCCSILINNSIINAEYEVTSKAQSSFTIFPEYSIIPFNYPFSSVSAYYSTTSKSAVGGIFETKITKNNSNNTSTPKVVNISSQSGKGAKLIVQSSEIGTIKNINLNDIGFEYQVDKSIQPKLNIPKIIYTEPLYTIKDIEVVNVPVSYNFKPELVLIDDFYGQKNNDLKLDYDIIQQKVNIIQNTQSIRGTNPFIIPTNNSVGIAISNISYNSVSKEVVVILESQYSDLETFPFSNGDKVLVENVVVGTNEKNYNSSLYDYALFEIDNVDPKIGGFGASFTYSMENYLAAGEVLGTYDNSQTKGFITPEKYFPTFNINLTVNNFADGEFLSSGDKQARLISEHQENGYIKLLSTDNFVTGDIITGKTSGTSIVASSVENFDAYIATKADVDVIDGWKKETGFFNNNLQRIHDNDYYQYFSYSLKSEVNYNEWNEVVNDLNHTAGFKNFADLVVYSEPTTSGVSTEAFSVVDVANVVTLELDMNCIDNYDLVTENYFYVDSDVKSSEIAFQNSIFQDYIESVGNRVLAIDPYYDVFSSDLMPDDNVAIDTFSRDKYYYKKTFVSVIDKWYPENSSFNILTVLQNKNAAILNQYAELLSGSSAGYFDVDRSGSNINIQFYPKDPTYSSYYINSISVGIGTNLIGISTVSLGNIAKIYGSNNNHIVGTGTTTIIGITSSTRAAKLLVGFAYTNDSHYEIDEITIIHDGTNIFYNNYGELQLSNSNIGVGTYNIYYSGTNINVDLIPNNIGIGTTCFVSSIVTEVKNGTFSGIGTTAIGNSVIKSNSTTITGGTPSEVLRYSKDNNGSYSFICVENTTTSTYSAFEFMSMYNPITNDSYYTEFGNVNSNNNLGIISSYVQSNDVIVEFRPSAANNYKIYAVTTILGAFQSDTVVSISSVFDFNTNYTFSEAGIFKSNKGIELLSNQLPIFKRTFNPITGIDTTKNSITIPEHYFVTGEELRYSPGNGSSVQTSTGNLPSTVFVIKINDNSFQLASSALNALAASPIAIDLTSAGTGTSHTFTSNYQTNRCLIAVDNLIQEPLVATATTTTLLSKIGYYDSVISLNTTNQLISGDYLQVDDEVVKILAVGFGSTNVCRVDRAILGTGISTHNATSLVKKIKGNYNVNDNKLYYETNPFIVQENESYQYEVTGRVFLKSGDINSTTSTYSKNYLLDDISNQFNGVTKEFTLTSNKNNVSNIDAIVLVNNVFQNNQFNYNLIESSGITSIRFTGAATSFAYDVNNASIPRGGVIVSLGSTQGNGYQPLVSAGGTAVVSLAGTIQNISIGNSGSGYRSGLQTVKVGVQTASVDVPFINYIGTASISNGSVVSVAITNPGVGYTAYPAVKQLVTTSQVGVGSTVIGVDNITGINTSQFVSIGIALTNARITGIGTTFITISVASTSNSAISVGSTATIKEYNPPEVIFDAPLSYSNLPLVYAPNSSGAGIGAEISVVVGQGSSVIGYEVTNFGYGYKVSDRLTVNYGGSTGIQTDPTKPFYPFTVVVDKVFYDEFTSWVVGDLQSFDPFDKFFNGSRTKFQLKVANAPTSVRTKPGSNINLENNLLIFINDVLQVPGEAYTFNGGSVVSFTEPPASTDKSKIVLYLGNSSIDTKNIDVIEDIKIGDHVIINSTDYQFQEDSRLVYDVIATDTVETNLYSGPGISTDENITRPITICRQTEDMIINGKPVGKDRVSYEPIIHPTTRLISNVSVASTQIFVEGLRTFFDNKNEYIDTDTIHRSIRIISQDENNLNYEDIRQISYNGDFGQICGVKTAQIGIASTAIVFQFFIHPNSQLRQMDYVVNGISGIKTGYYFSVSKSNIGSGVVSLENNEVSIASTTSFLNNVYKAYSVSIGQTFVTGIGVTNIVEVTSKVDRFIVGTGVSNYYGDFSWGVLHSFERPNPKEFILNPSGILTSPIVQRKAPLKYQNYYN
jgi:hypothetical protein